MCSIDSNNFAASRIDTSAKGPSVIPRFIVAPNHPRYVKYTIAGMDARVKCERLRQGFKIYKKAGPGFLGRLEFFEKKAIPIRNILVHSPGFILEEDQDKLHFSSYSKSPFNERGAAKEIAFSRLDAISEWLNYWTWDIVMAPHDQAVFETDSPISNPPQEDQ